MPKRYVPERGDLVWIHFTPQAGREQAGHRPAVVVSPRTYNDKAGLALFCPITSQSKGYPFEVALPDGFPVKGVVLCDHLKSLDYASRQTEFAAQLPPESVKNILAKIRTLLGPA